MPRVNVYIRQENWEQWQAIQNKSDFVNTQLANSAYEIVNPRDVFVDPTVGHNDSDFNPYHLPKVTAAPLPKILKTLQAAKGVTFCKHNQVLGLCKKGCR